MNDLAMLIFVVALFGPSIKITDSKGYTRFIYKGLLIAFIDKAIDMVNQYSDK
ncbi:hypothetical protein P7G96_09955 [Enterococcus thailandicus]|uniref:hypothetical protein n=1 Tax=Enterococcus thailandicus TaxID=417368 RepID=UPI00289005FB|nr:hypothetical protein [Enterococcus thailandicus]MDT2752322.1 hypothetical protein [Enterococcus thailandicus]MDT2776815.1 hypothetical protein [Enterococcus thailandicus]